MLGNITENISHFEKRFCQKNKSLTPYRHKFSTVQEAKEYIYIEKKVAKKCKDICMPQNLLY
jgi:hypothetical protein